MGSVEFYIYNNELWYMADGENHRLTEKDTRMVGMMLDMIMQTYPEAYKALCDVYKRSALNVPYYQFLIVRRFCKCNFGLLDNTRKDVAGDGEVNMECVLCPLRGECAYEGVICKPKMNVKLTDMEYRVMKSLYNGNSTLGVAEELYINMEAVKSTRKRVYQKLGIHDRGEFMKWAERNNMFNED